MSEEQKDIQVSTENGEETSSYRSIFKATTLFGGVQVWKILISIIQTKFVALVLGPTGMGIKGMYSSATNLIQSITAMGLSNSAVRDVSEANGNGDAMKVSRTVAVLRKLVWFTGLLGMVSVFVLSPVLSKTTFGDYSYTIPFIILSVTLLLSQLTTGQNVILQGTRKLKYLAKAGMIGSVISLIVTVPFYYFWGIKGIVPTMVLEAISLLIIAYYYASKVKTMPINITLKEAVKEGKGMMTLGLVMTYNSMLVLGCMYVFRVFITRTGGISDVGLYTAGAAVVNSYVGLIFSAMTTDYYPRLAAVCHDDEKCKRIVNQQIEMAMLVIAPALMLFLMLAPGAVIFLYSDKFLPIVGFMKWAALGVFFKTISWAISYQIVAKGDKKAYASNETLSCIIGLALNIAAYYEWGITGVGISILIGYVIYLIIVYCVAYKKYNYSLSGDVIRLGLVLFACLVMIFLMQYLWETVSSYLLSMIVLMVGCYYSYRELDKRINIKDTILQTIKRTKR